MANVITGDIQDLNVSWENYSGDSVEKFIKSELKGSCGYLYRTQSKIGDFYYLYGFHNVDEYNDWLDGDSSITPLFRVQLPNVENDVYSTNLYTTSNTNKLVNLGDGVIINIRYTSTSTNPTTQEVSDTYNDGTLIIQRSANGSSYVEVARLTIQPDTHDGNTYQAIDVTNYLADGDNKLRLKVEDNITGAISNNINFASIVNTTLKITNATPTDTPLTTTQFMYYIEGQVSKTLNIKINQNGSNQTFSFPISDGTYIEAPYIATVNASFETGTIKVEAWLSVDDTTLESTHIENEFYIIDTDSEETVIILNNKATEVTNYDNVHFFDFVLFNHSSDVNIKVEDASNVYINYTQNNCEINTTYSFYNILQIESEAETINAIVTVTTDSTSDSYSITIDNTENMNPTSGADFVINTQKRNNSEYEPNSIINDVTGLKVTSTFTGFNFVNDGWINDDEGYKILRIPAGHSISINYDPLDTLSSGTTIELDYKVYNIFNDNDVVFSFDSETQGGIPLGFIMNATECTFYTVDNQVKRDQDVIFQEEVRTHLAINIIPNLSNSGLNYIRIFINGVMNREMLYKSSDIFKNGTLTIDFGSENCDFDLYGMRIYKKALSASDIRQDFMSTIPELENKLLFKEANNILSANGTISYDKASVKYNTLVWTGNVPSLLTGDVNYYGTLKINIIDDLAHSGDIINLRDKGQGSSSKNYWKWNQQWDWNKLEDENENVIPSVWTDGYGVEHTDGYRLCDDEPAMKKMVAKLNWASSMQSHKAGSTALYTDLWRKIVGGNSITKTDGYEDVRVTVHEEPFLFFVRETATSTPVFYGLMTFGSGKFDKATFGYDKNLFTDYLVLEGSDNGMPLTNRQVPWFTEEVTYNSKEEYYEYAGAGNLDYGMGNQNMLSYFINAFNFAYELSPRLRPYTNDSELLDVTYQYWNTSTYKVVRYDYITKTWVNAGTTRTSTTVNDVTTVTYSELDILEQTGLTATGDSEVDNAAFINWRVNYFKNRVNVYYNVNDVLFSMAFLKLVAASDNRCKNTYEYLDPGTHKICLAQDDMDTLMLTDNVGRKTKPYYVEEHDSFIDENSQLKYYFNGQDNVFFTLMDMAFDSELRQTMNTIFETMTTTDFGESAEQCLQNYFFHIQEYFPAVAYNETARLLYEEASVAQSQNIYYNGTPAISQSLGDQLQAEKQWFKRRLRYLQSWAAADPFKVRSAICPALNFRSVLTSGGTNPSYQFTLTPWQWLYPKVGIGQTLGSDNTRVQVQNEYTTTTLTTDGNTDTFIYGIDYYTNVGEFGDKSIGETFQLAGNRLIRFSADSRNVTSYEFKPIAMTINCPVLKYLSLYGCTTLSGSLDLSNEIKLEEVDLRGTGLTTVNFPESGSLDSIYIPNLTSITLYNCDNLNTIVSEGYTNLISLYTDNSTLALQAVNNATNLATIQFRNINLNITDSTISDNFYNLLIADNCSCTGVVKLNKTLTSAEKNALTNKYGSIDSTSNTLYIEYNTSSSNEISISGDSEIGQGKTKSYTVVYSGNDIKSYTWTITGAGSYTTNKNTCTITASDSSVNDILIEVVVTRVSNSGLSATKTINVIENIVITEISVDDVVLDSIDNYPISINYLPSNYTVGVNNINVSMISNNNGRIINYTTNQIDIEYHTLVTDTIATLPVSITIEDVEGNTVEGSFNVSLTNPIQQLLLNGTTVIWTKQ